jgi:hypothetical protein
VHCVTVTDLESNITYPLDVRVSKTVERSKTMDDGSYISVRKNSWGKNVYTVPANDDDLLNKRGALISKAIRTLGLRIIPGDLQDEAERIIKDIRINDIKADPDAARKQITDAFIEIGVKASDLVAYLGHSIDACSPSQLNILRGIYGAIKDGEATWKAVMENKAEQEKATTKPTYPDEKFSKDLVKWGDLILKGKRTPEEIIATAQTAHPLSDAQKAQINALPRKPADPPASKQEITYAEVEKGLLNAKTVDALATAADLIGMVADPKENAKLKTIYETRKADIGD